MRLSPRQARGLLLGVLSSVLLGALLLLSSLLTSRPPSPPHTSLPSPHISSNTALNLTSFSQIRKKYELISKKKASIPVDEHLPEPCGRVLPIFHGEGDEKSRNVAMVNSVLKKEGGFLETFPGGMALIWPYHIMSEARCSVWSPQTGRAMVSAPELGYFTPGKEWIIPPAEPWTPHLVVHGPHVFFHSWFSGNYGHFLVDHLPSISWLREKVSPDTRFLLLKNNVAMKFIKWFDVEFYHRIVWIETGQIVEVKGDLMVLNRTKYKNTNATLIDSFHKWSDSRVTSLLPFNDLPSKKIVYHSRSGKSTAHGRVVDARHEEEILLLIRHAMLEFNRSEELVVFNGYLGDSFMTFQQQYELMQSTSVYIGPHGTGMCNAVFLHGGEECPERPKVLEFTCGHSPNCSVQDGGAHRSSYFQQASIPWADYHQVNYNSQLSTKDITFVDLHAFKLALRIVFDA